MVCLPPGFGRKHLNQVFAGQDVLDTSDDVLRLERLPVVLADVPRCDEAGLGPQVASELTAEVVLDDDNSLAPAQDVGDFIHVATWLEYISEGSADDLMEVRRVAAPLSGLIGSLDSRAR